MTTRGVAVVSCVLAVAGGVLGCVGDAPLPATGSDGGSDAASDGIVTDASTTPDGAPIGDGGTCDGVSQCLGTILGWAPVSFAEGSTVACPQGAVEIRRGGTNPPSGLACSACACGSATCSSSTIELYSPSSSCGDPQPAVTLSVGRTRV